MSSSITHRDAMLAIIKERGSMLAHHNDYLQRTITRLRELKLRQALGERLVRGHGGSYNDKPIGEVIESERNTLKYAIDSVRRSRRELWKVYRLQRTQRVREVSRD